MQKNPIQTHLIYFNSIYKVKVKSNVRLFLKYEKQWERIPNRNCNRTTKHCHCFSYAKNEVASCFKK